MSKIEGAEIIAKVLAAAAPRPQPDDSQSAKTQYAVRFAEAMATHIAFGLQPRLRGIDATTKRTAGSVRGTAQLDINFSTPQFGLLLGISLKSVHIRDKGSARRYTHNMKRNAEELRIEASGYHQRQPYAVMVGVVFLPYDSCDDAKTDASSFGSWVRHLRPYCGRDEPGDSIDLFEKIYVAFYEVDGGALNFFDVAWDPPKRNRPQKVLAYSEFLDDVHHAYLSRNHRGFRWSDGEEAPISDQDVDEEDD